MNNASSTAQQIPMKCETCRGFFPFRSGRTGQCRIRRPDSVLIGQRPPPPNPTMLQMRGPGGAIAGANGVPTPIVNGYFPPTSADVWCCEWQLNEAVLQRAVDLASVTASDQTIAPNEEQPEPPDPAEESGQVA